MASPAWERRNRMAQQKGFRNYYEYRQHDYGKRPRTPDATEERQRLAGQRGNRAFKKQLATRADKIALIVAVPEAQKGGGEWTKMRFIATYTDATIREYVVDLDVDDLDWWEEEFDDMEIDYIAYGKASE